MAENEQAVDQFLKSIMTLRYGSAEGKLGQQKLQLAQQRLNAEQMNHAADMKQRASQFGEEMSLRQKQQDNTESYQKAMLDETKATRADASQRDFRDRGGLLQDTPQDQTFNFEGGHQQTPAVQSMLPQIPGLTVPPQPVGPAAPGIGTPIGEENLQQGLPIGHDISIPMQGTLAAEAQRPDPSLMNRVTPPLGTPAGQEAYIPTAKGKALQTREAENEGAQMQVTPELAAALPDLGLKPGSKIDRRLLPLMEKGMDFKLAQAEKQSEFAASLEERRKSREDANQIKMAILATKAAKGEGDVGKMYGESILDNPDAKIPAKFQPDALKYVRENYDMKSLPADMPAGDVRPVEGAMNSLNMVTSLKAKLQDPLIANNLGPIMGPTQDLAQRFGDDPRFKGNPGAITAMQDFRSEVTGNLANELQAINPRAASSLLGMVQKMAPNERMSAPMFEGALNGMATIAYNRIKTARDRQFGGKAPDAVMSKYPKPQQPIGKENPLWRKQGDANFIDKDDSKIVNAGGKRVWIYHDGASDKYYQLATLPGDK